MSWWRSKPLLLLVSLATGLITGDVARHQITNQSATLDVEALITKGTVFRIYYNNQWNEPQAAAIRPNQWTHYRFETPSRIIALRFDPSDEAHAQAYIRSIVIRGGGGGRSEQVAVSQLTEWIGANVHAEIQPGGKLVLLTTDTPGGYLMDAENIDVGARIQILQYFRLNPNTLFWCLFAATVILLLAGVRRNEIGSAIFIFGVVACAVLGARFTALQVLRIKGPLPPVTSTVGAAAYTAFSKSIELYSLNVAICVSVALTLLGVFVWKRHRRESFTIRFTLGNTDAVPLRFFIGVLAICALVSFPPAADYLSSAMRARHATDFDSQNLITWQFLAHQGKLPWRDFWFPYGGAYNQLAPLYPEILYKFLHDSLLLGILLWCAFKIFRNRVWAVVSCCVLFFLLESTQMFWPGASARYFLSLSVVLLVAVAVQEGSLKYFALLGIWCVYVISQELSQIIYAIPASAVLVTAAGTSAISRRDRIRLAKNAATGLTSAAVCLLVYFAVLFHNSQLAGWWAFVRSLNDQADYGAWPARIQEWVSLSGGLDSGLLALTLLLVIGGLIHLVWPAERRNIYCLLPLSIGLLCWMLLQKQIVRPGIERQILAVSVFGTVVLVFQRIQSVRGQRQMLWMSFSMALLFSCFILDAQIWNGQILPRLARVRAFPRHVSALFAADEWTKATHAFFSPESFDFGATSGTALRDRLRASAPTAPGESIYVLGNDPLLYVLLQKSVPYYTNIYNESPIDSQRTTLAWLRQNRPEYIVWDVDARDFDGVPNVVRIPLIFTYVMEHYRPAGAEGKYQILKRLDEHEPPAVDYWIKTLGSAIDLGYVPAASSLNSQEAGGSLAPVLIVHTKSPREGCRISIPLDIGHNRYAIAFTERARRDTYIVRLDRVPLLEAARASGIHAQVSGAVDRSIQPQFKMLPVPANDLY